MWVSSVGGPNASLQCVALSVLAHCHLHKVMPGLDLPCVDLASGLSVQTHLALLPLAFCAKRWFLLSFNPEAFAN
jgi:hypothetical protein